MFLKAQGYKLGASFIEDVFVDAKRREKKIGLFTQKEFWKNIKIKLFAQ